MIRTSQPGWNEGAITLSASRSRLRTLFRTTAPPSLRPVESPKRVSPRSVRRTRTTSRVLDLTVPCPCSAAKSSGLESITSRGGLWPRSAVRPTASSGRGRGGRRARGARPLSSSGRGSHVPWRDAASWADRSASSDAGYLSMSASGSGYPVRHANAPSATSSASARLPADYMNAPVGLSTTPDRRRRPPEAREGRSGPDSGLESPIPPGSIRFEKAQILAGAAGPVLFFGGPLRQTTIGPRPGGTVKGRRAAPTRRSAAGP
jgi:hypothetical protein